MIKAELKVAMHEVKYQLLNAMERRYREEKRDLAKIILDL